MKVGILTWYKAINHGAVLQAYASSEILKSLGHTPVILDFERITHYSDRKKQKNKIIRRIKNYYPGKIKWYYKVNKLYKIKCIEFEKFRHNELNVGNNYKNEQNLDAVYVGSDMVFDITEGYSPYMYGIDVPSDNIFSYAASFGCTKINELLKFEKYNEIVDGLKQFKAIGYRDKNTYEICHEILPDIDCVENIDPALCYGFSKEIEAWDSGKWKNRKYILIYAYDSTMNDIKTTSIIRNVASKENLEVISCGYYHSWVDKCVSASPKEFIEMFKHAKYIITDTFHGTVFSLLLKKNFVSIIRNNGFKLRYLLECIHLEDRIGKHDIEEILSKQPQYDYFDTWIAEQQKKSRDFIEENIRFNK